MCLIQKELAAGQGEAGVDIGDLDGDGDSDVVLAIRELDRIDILSNSGGGAFSAEDPIELSGAPADVAVGQLDATGDVEVAVGTLEGTHVFSRGLGGEYSLLASLEIGAGNVHIAPGADSQSNMLVFAADPGGLGVAVLENNALSGPTYLEAPPCFGTAIRSTDLTGDGILDLVASFGCNSDDASRWGATWAGDGAGSFGAPLNLDVGGDVWDVAVHDLDADGSPDLLFSGRVDGDIAFLRGDGSGGFGTPEWYCAVPDAIAVEVLDANHDSIPDAIVAGYGGELALLLGGGDGSLQAQYRWRAPTGIDMAAGDLDGDGRTDVVTSAGTVVFVGE